MKRALLDALQAKYEAEIAEADAVVNIYLEKSVGIEPSFGNHFVRSQGFVQSRRRNAVSMRQHGR